MGTEAIHSEAAESHGVSTYTVIVYPARALPEQYRAMIFAKWLRSLRHGNDYFKLVDAKSYYTNYNRFLGNVLSRETAAVRLAVLSDDRDVVLGFSVSHDNVLDYVHVHKDQRRMGIGKHLVPPGIDTISHLTRTAMGIWGNKYGHWKFDPFA